MHTSVSGKIHYVSNEFMFHALNYAILATMNIVANQIYKYIFCT